jgi:hypothetical protein
VWQILLLRGLLGAMENLSVLANVIMGELTQDDNRAGGQSWASL